MSDVTYYKRQAYQALSDDHQALLTLGPVSESEDVYDTLERLEVLKPCDGCVPDEFVDGDLERIIWQKFALIADRAVWLVGQKYPEIKMRITISATFEGDTVVLVTEPDRKWVLLDQGIDAWNFEFETLKEVVAKILEWSAEIVDTYAEHKLRTLPQQGTQRNLC